MTVVVSEFTNEVILANRAKWTAALRSGDYEQTKGKLATPAYDGFCCLGVACEVIGAEYGVRRTPEESAAETYCYDNPEYAGDASEDSDTWYREPIIRAEGDLPGPLYPALGLSYAAQCSLAAMNDGEGAYTPASFAAIADHIDSLPICRDIFA